MPNTKLEEFCSLPLTVVGEMANKVDIPFKSFDVTDDEKFLDEIEKDEREEKIIYAYSDSGISENKRNWSADIMKSISGQVIEKMPVGYLGHIKPSDYGFEFPDPQIVWFGSCTEKVGTSTRLWIKGYLLPTSEKLETWIKTKAVDSISVYGKISYKMKGEVMEILEVDLKSIDIARKLGEGLNSGIVGLYGEMENTYEAVKDKIQQKAKKYFTDNCYSLGIKEKPIYNPNSMCNHDDTPYIYCWVKKMYVGENRVIVTVEGKYPDNFYFEILYKLDKDNEVTLTSITEVEENVSYDKKKNGIKEKVTDNKVTDASEMDSINKEVKEMPNNFTLQDVMDNKEVYNELKKSIAQEMASENSQKVLTTKAGEMDKLTGLIGEQEDMYGTIEKIVNFNAKFVGEMSTIFVGESDEELTPDEIVEKTKEAVETVKQVKEVVNADDDEDVVEKVQQVVEAQNELDAKSAIEEVDKKFADLIAKVKDETIAEFVKDDFLDIVGLKPEDIDGDIDDWKEEALKAIEDNFQGSVDKYTARLNKAFKKGKAVGEMNAFENLGGNLGGTDSKNNVDEDPDIAEAKRLGYGI